MPISWNASTGYLAYYDHRSFEIWIRGADGTTRRFLGAPGRKRSGRFSPDGKWLAFVSDETGEYQVYVTACPGPGPTVAVSTKGGLPPIWSADGRELFFRLGGRLLSGRVSTQSPIAFTAPRKRRPGSSPGAVFVSSSGPLPLVGRDDPNRDLDRLTTMTGVSDAHSIVLAEDCHYGRTSESLSDNICADEIK